MPPTTDPSHFDALVIGGGPAGATAALVLARRGGRVAVLEKERFPRFRIGESFVPRNFTLLRDLGLEAPLRRLPHVPKFGAEFAMGDAADDDRTNRFDFAQGLFGGGGGEAFNLERAAFDQMLLDEAAAAGATVVHGAGVARILHLADGDVRVATERGEFSARYLIDASGQACVVGRHLGTRRPATQRHLRKVAYFAHFEGVWRREGREAGHPVIVMCEEGWFWLIPLDGRRTSVGMVLDADVARAAGVPADRMLAWGVARCPLVRRRMANATGPARNRVVANFSYACRPFAGPGYFLVGDAAAFLDPIFSTGVCLGMMGAAHLGERLAEVLAGRRSPASARRAHQRYLDGSTGTFARLIEQYYDHSFRELFLNGSGPLGVHKAVLAALAGHVFPRPPWAVRWRLALFGLYVRLNRRLPLVPRRARCSLLSAASDESETPWHAPSDDRFDLAARVPRFAPAGTAGGPQSR